MMVRCSIFRVSLLLLSVVVGSLRAEWPQFRGPTGQGISPAQGLPLKWSEEKHIVWKVAIPGKGWSSPVVAADQVWLTTALDDGKSLRAIGIHRVTGKVLHDVEVFAPKSPVGIEKKGSHAAPTSVLRDGRLYVHFGTMGTACLATDSGRVLWRCTEFEKYRVGETSSSPVLFENRLILHFDGSKEPFVAALESETGRLAWKRLRSLPLRENTLHHRAFATPLLVQVGDRWQLISPAADQTHAYDPRTGEEIWHVRYLGFATVPRPVADRQRLFLATGFGNPSELWCIKLEAGMKGDVTDSHVLWKYSRQVPTVPSLLLLENRLYMVSDKGIATCLRANNGELMWQERLGDSFGASPVAADGRIYFVGESGKATVIAAGDEFKVLAVNQLPGWHLASPAVAGKSLFLRTDTHLYRIEH